MNLKTLRDEKREFCLLDIAIGSSGEATRRELDAVEEHV